MFTHHFIGHIEHSVQHRYACLLLSALVVGVSLLHCLFVSVCVGCDYQYEPNKIG